MCLCVCAIEREILTRIICFAGIATFSDLLIRASGIDFELKFSLGEDSDDLKISRQFTVTPGELSILTGQIDFETNRFVVMNLVLGRYLVR